MDNVWNLVQTAFRPATALAGHLVTAGGVNAHRRGNELARLR